MKKENQDVIQEKTTLKEKISLKFRRNWITNKAVTILLILILFAAYICLNLWIKTVELPEIDVTENKIFTLSDASIKAVEKVENEVTIYAFGFEEDGNLIKLLKQYQNANDKIKYEILTNESNYAMVQEYDLQDGYTVLIMKSGDSEKVIDGSTEFSTFDYTTYQSIDVTEQTITNSILALDEENKPKIYFMQGHGEYASSEIRTITTILKNEAFETEELNLITSGNVPDDCDVLAILTPINDFTESEAQAVRDYISKGGDIYFSTDTLNESMQAPNLQSILDQYGVSVENGYIIEYEENHSVANAPYVFIPQISGSHKITEDIYTDNPVMWLSFSAKLNFKDDTELANLNVTKETLLSSSENSIFIRDLDTDISKAISTGETGVCEIASVLSKTVPITNENGEETTTTSNMVIIATGSFASDHIVNEVSKEYPLSYFGSNKDFAINAMSFLGDKGNHLTIRKDMANSAYLPTQQENNIVIAVTFLVPIAIMFTGIMVGSYRKRRK